MRQITIRVGDDAEKKRKRRGRRAIVAVLVLAALVVIAMPRTPPPKPPVTTTTTTTAPIATTSSTATTSTTATATTATTPPPAPGHLAPLPPELAFAAQLGTVSAPKLVRLRNDGDEPLAIASLVARGDAFRLLHDCPPILAKSESCSAAIVFVPAIAGAQRGAITLQANGETAAVTLTGVARPSPPIDLGVVDFGSAPVDTKRPTRPLRFANGRPIAVNLGKTIVSGPFAVVADRCSGARVAPGGACDVTFAIATTETGAFAGKLQLVDAQNDVVAFGALAAEATPVRVVETPPAKIDIAPRQILFSQRARGRQSILLTNRGGRATTIAVEANGVPFGFTVDTKACNGRTLNPGESCTILVSALPVAYQKSSSMRILVSYDGHTDGAAVVAK